MLLSLTIRNDHSPTRSKRSRGRSTRGAWTGRAASSMVRARTHSETCRGPFLRSSKARKSEPETVRLQSVRVLSANSSQSMEDTVNLLKVWGVPWHRGQDGVVSCPGRSVMFRPAEANHSNDTGGMGRKAMAVLVAVRQTSLLRDRERSHRAFRYASHNRC